MSFPTPKITISRLLSPPWVCALSFSFSFSSSSSLPLVPALQMPDLGSILNNSTSLNLTIPLSSPPPPPPPPCPIEDFKLCRPEPSTSMNSHLLNTSPVKTLVLDRKFSDNSVKMPEILSAGNGEKNIEVSVKSNGGLKIKIVGMSRGALDRNQNVPGGKGLEDYLKAWKETRIASGVPEDRCFIPFIEHSPKLDECRACSRFIFPGDGVSCSVRSCPEVYHLRCAKDHLGCSVLKKFKCPLHSCFLCKQKFHWRCVRCALASHDNCAPWLNEVVYLHDRPGWAICWRHPKDWRLDKQQEVPVDNIEEIFSCLPLPYVEEEFKLDSSLKECTNSKMEPPPYVHIRRNMYLVKKKRDDAFLDIGCTNCSSGCGQHCVCRVQCISCSKACGCSETCRNRPFRKEKRIKVVKTELCGWGVEAAEFINKDEFVIEYIGEVIDDALCEQRLWDMKHSGVKNFYMCEIHKDLIIDASFKGNASRFLNHSCDPNCKLEKWQVEGEIRVGVFASQPIKVGEPLTYDYRFVQFGPEVECHCGAANCQGFLGMKKKVALTNGKVGLAEVCWGSKRKRSSPTRFSRCQIMI